MGLHATTSDAQPERHTRRSYDEMFMDIESQESTESLINKSRQRPEMQQIQSDGPSSPLDDIHPESGLPMDHLKPDRSHPHQEWDGAVPGAQEARLHHCKNLSFASRAISIVVLVTATILIAICAEFFASSFGVLNEKGILGESFVGLIVIPVAGNVAENVTAVIVAHKNQLDLAISVALGSAIQIGLLVAPVIVLVAWALEKPMTLHFDRFGMVTLVGSALLVSFLVLKGKTNYLEGAILCACFAAISYASFPSSCVHSGTLLTVTVSALSYYPLLNLLTCIHAHAFHLAYTIPRFMGSQGRMTRWVPWRFTLCIYTCRSQRFHFHIVHIYRRINQLVFSSIIGPLIFIRID